MNDMKRFQKNDEQIKVLNLFIQNAVTTYAVFSFPLCGILWEPGHYAWLYQHFIHLYSLTAEDEDGGFWLDYMEARDFYKEAADFLIIKADAMQQEPDIIRFIEEKIAAGYYIILFVDKYFLPQMRSYHKMHFVHQIMIYGYDQQQQQLYTLAYDDKYNFINMVHSYKEVYAAYENGKSCYSASPPWVKAENTELVRPRLDRDFKFDLARCMADLKTYLAGTGEFSGIRPLNIKVYGTNAHYNAGIYDEFIRNVQISNGDFRFYHLLAEHKSLMHKRIRYIAEINELKTQLYSLPDVYAQVEEKFLIARNIYVKEGFVNNWCISPDTRKEIIKLIRSGQELEATVLNKCINALT